MQREVTDKRVVFNDILEEEVSNVTQDYMSELSGLLKSSNLKIAVIESITGGGIARKIVETPGCSDYFLGGVVAYNPKLKIQYGLVSPKSIADHGIVSATVTEEMASGIKKMTKADITIASNGIAGPQNETYSIDQSGTIFLSWNIRDKIMKTKRFKIEGGRNEVIDKSIFTALSMCLRYLKMEIRKES